MALFRRSVGGRIGGDDPAFFVQSAQMPKHQGSDGGATGDRHRGSSLRFHPPCPSCPTSRTPGSRVRGRSLRRCLTLPLVLVLLVPPVSGAEQPKVRSWKKVWVVSALAFTAATFLDAQSSVGGYERNPLLRDSRGQFSSARGVGYKSAAVGGVILMEALFARRHAEVYKWGALSNFAGSGAMAAAAVANHRTSAALARSSTAP